MQTYKFIFPIVTFLVIVFISHSFAASGEKLSVNGYLLDVSASQMGDDILVHGIISGGESCKKLVATIYFQNDESRSASVKVIANNYGGREPFSIRKRVKAKKSSRWTVSSVYMNKY